MKTPALKALHHRAWIAIIIPFIAITFFIIARTIVNSVDYHNSDFFTFWLSGRLASQGLNPYDSQVWIAGHQQYGATWMPNETFIYPLQVSLLFIPLGLLDLFQAYILWDVLLQFMILTAIILLALAAGNQSVKPYYLPLIGGAVIFRPTLVSLTNGQFSGFLLLILAVMVYLWEKGKWTQGAVLLPFLALKPNLGVPIIAFLVVYLLQQKKTAALLAGAVSGLFLLLVGWIQNPRWLSGFWNAGNAKLSQMFGFSPNIWGVSAHLCDYHKNCALGFGAFFCLVFLFVYIFLIVKKSFMLSPALVVSLAVITMLLVTPYYWAYDQLLLVVPIVTITMCLARHGYRYLPVSLIFFMLGILSWALVGIAYVIHKDVWTIGVPLCVLGLLIWCLTKGRVGNKKIQGAP